MPTFNQLVKFGRERTKYKTASPALQSCPQKRGVCTLDAATPAGDFNPLPTEAPEPPPPAYSYTAFAPASATKTLPEASTATA